MLLLYCIQNIFFLTDYLCIPNVYIEIILFVQIRRTTDAASDIDCRQLNKKKKRKGKGKGKSGSNSGMGDDDDEMDGINGLSPEKQLTCSLILQELNNKMRVVAWKPT